MFVKENSGLPEIQLDLCKATWNPSADQLPAVVPAKGLSVERQWYLH